MPLSFSVQPNMPRISWGKIPSFNGENNDERSTSKKRVCFEDRAPRVCIESNYEITESVQKTLWYRPKDLQKIREKIVASFNNKEQATTNSTEAKRVEHCTRGLEMMVWSKHCLGSNKGYQTPHYRARQIRHAAFTARLMSYQKQVWARHYLGALDAASVEEKLRAFCLKNSQSQEEHYAAHILAAEDARVALQIYETSFRKSSRFSLLLRRQEHPTCGSTTKQMDGGICNHQVSLGTPVQARVSTRAA